MLMNQDITYLTPGQKTDIEHRIKVIENEIRMARTGEESAMLYVPRNFDVAKAMVEIRKLKKMLDTRTAPRVDKKDETSLNKRRIELEEQIKEGMLTKDEYMGKRRLQPGNARYYQEADSNCVDRFIKWQARTDVLIREWKRIMRILEPDDPNSTNVERLRPNKKRR